MSPVPDPRTPRGQVGLEAEEVARRYLGSLGWIIRGSNLVIGRDELDMVCTDPDGSEDLVFVEVRGHTSGRFGAAEESIDRRKLARICRAALQLLRSGWPEEHGALGGRPQRIVTWRVDVIAVELHPMLARDIGGPRIRHIRGVTAD